MAEEVLDGRLTIAAGCWGLMVFVRFSRSDFLGEFNPGENLDPSRPGADRNTELDSAGFDVNFGPAETGSINLTQISGINDVPVQWVEWRDNSGAESYLASGASSWFSYTDRMWYLLNLTRIALLDQSILDSPTDIGLERVGFLTDTEKDMLRLG